MTEALPKKTKFGDISSGGPTQLNDNRDSVKHVLTAVACGRLVLMEAFYDSKPPDVSLEDWHREWAAFQVAPKLSYLDSDDPSEDIFVHVFRLLLKANINTLEDIRCRTWKSITSRGKKLVE